MQSLISRFWSSVSYMVKWDVKPMFSPNLRSILVQQAWKVDAHISDPCSPTLAHILSFSSFAALFVKVMASILQGLTLDTESFCANSSDRVAVPSAASLISAVSSAEYSPKTLSLSYASPQRRICATRLTSTVVFPLPAPARISSGPFTVRAAVLCISLRFENSFSIIFFLRDIISFLVSSVIVRSALLNLYNISALLYNNLRIYSSP